MTPEQVDSIIPNKPVDGHTVEYWRVDSADLKYPVHCVCRYDVNTPWKDHPWGMNRDDHPGADFEDDWSIWVEYTPGNIGPSGRVTGWDSLREHYLLDKTVYGTQEEAYQALIERKKASARVLQERVDSLNADIARLSLRVGM